MSNKTSIWLDCDPGHDDAFAILLATHHPSLNLLGISTTHGNASLALTTLNARRILASIGRSSAGHDVSVYPGAERPFSRDRVRSARDIHGESGIDGSDLLPSLSVAVGKEDEDGSGGSMMMMGSAILAMREAILAQARGEVWIVATGAWTNVALLFAGFPDVADWVAGVSLMGGAVGDGFSGAKMGSMSDRGVWEGRVGNTTPWAEFNVFCDPESARSLLRNPLLQGKIIMIGLDVTHLALASEAVQQRVLHGDTRKETGTPHPMRQMFHDLLTFFSGTYRDAFGFTDGPPLHDPLAVAVVLDILGIEEFGFEDGEVEGEKGEQWIVDVVTDDREEDSQLGRTVLVRQINGKELGVRIPRRIRHLNRFWDMIELALQKAEMESDKTGIWDKLK